MNSKVVPQIFVFNPAARKTAEGKRVGSKGKGPTGKTHVGDVLIRGREVDGTDMGTTPRLATLDMLRGVTSIIGSLTIVHDPRLQTLNALQTLQHVSENFVVRYCPNLIDVSAILGPNGEARVEVGGLFDARNNGVAPNRIRVHSHGDVVVQSDKDLLKLAKMIRGGLTKIPGNLIIRGTTSTSLDVLKGLEEVGGALEISDNPGLVDLSFKTLKRVGAMAIFGNPHLRHAEFQNLGTVKAWMTFIQNRRCESARFPQLGFVGKGLLVKENPELEELRLPELRESGDDPYLEFQSNPSLPLSGPREVIDRFRRPILDFFRGLRFKESRNGVFFGKELRSQGSAVLSK